MIPQEIKDMVKDFLKAHGLKVMIVIFCLLVGILSVTLFKMGKDNPIEQLAEEIIKEETGVDIDLTPEGKEK